jgi:FtsP/CotA-like multicopper oxidase with cupredoxin domain
MDESQRFSRRTFVAWVGGASAGYYLFGRLPGTSAPVALAQLPGGTLDPTTVPKYIEPLIIPPAMPRAPKPHNVDRPGVRVDYYEIAVRQFGQQILPPGLPATTVWSYGSAHDPRSFNYPAFTIEATHRQPVRVKWINDLVDSRGNYLPHLLPVDQTLHWANPPGGPQGRDGHGTDPAPYTGPVPIVTHLHGGHSTQESDGFPEAWYLPKAKNIPGGFARRGSLYQTFRAKAQAALGQAWTPGSAVFQYDNDQRAATEWFHDHTLGMTRCNVYAGPAGFYLLRGGSGDAVTTEGGDDAVLPGPAPALGDPADTKYYEIPLAIQDRSFNEDGSLFYPNNRAFFEGLDDPSQLQIPFMPEEACGGPSDIAPIWNPEFFGNAMVVNGRTWPFLEVERRRYRFRLLNGCDARFLALKFEHPDADVWQIGTEGGFLPEPVRINDIDVQGVGAAILLSPAERADVIVDFTDVDAGTEIILSNLGPDEPFGGFPAPPPNEGTTGQVMKFKVVSASSPDPSTPPDQLVLPPIPAIPAATKTRQVSLNEEVSRTVFVTTDAEGNIVLDCASDEPFGPAEADLGTLNADGTGRPRGWDEPITENPAIGATEVWELHNFTADAHPIHIHEVQFEVIDRETLEGGSAQPLQPWEIGARKDTVIAYPGEITRVRATFDRAGLFVWHCHILEHEDNEMMRPYRVGPSSPSGAFAAPEVNARRATRRRRRRKRGRRRRARGRSTPAS